MSQFNGIWCEVTVLETVWQFPEDRFVQYEPEDEWWARAIGYGCEVQKLVTKRFANCSLSVDSVEQQDGKVRMEYKLTGDPQCDAVGAVV